MIPARSFALALAICVFIVPRVAFAGCTSTVVPIQGLGEGSDLSGISASSASDVWAVGDGAPKYAPSDAFIEHFDGSAWHATPVHFYVRRNSLRSVAAVGPTDAWAVGSSYFSGGANVDLILRWNGSVWTTMWDPGNFSANNELYSVAVDPSNANDVWVIGHSEEQGIAHGTSMEKMLHWNGKGWHIYTYRSYWRFLVGVAISPTGQAWAVGTFSGSLNYPLAYHWDGTGWVSQSVPGYGSLSSVAAFADNDVWAVGSGSHGALIEHYDGLKWSTVPSPGDGSGVGLQSITGTSSSDLWAVGSRKRSGHFRTLMEHWDGVAWLIVPSSNPFLESLLTGVQALPGGALAVGYGQWANSPTQPISERASCTPRIR
jgi:hypothetical protein